MNSSKRRLRILEERVDRLEAAAATQPEPLETDPAETAVEPSETPKAPKGRGSTRSPRQP